MSHASDQADIEYTKASAASLRTDAVRTQAETIIQLIKISNFDTTVIVKAVTSGDLSLLTDQRPDWGPMDPQVLIP